MIEKSNRLNRRIFLQSGVVAGAAGLGVHTAAADTAPTERIDPAAILNYQSDMKYRRMADTDMYISVISMGGLVNEPGVHEYAIDNGVNLVHICVQYMGGRSIVQLGELMKTHRDKVYIAVKDAFFNQDDLRNRNYDKINGVLETLNTNYIDLLMYNRHDAESAQDPLIQESYEALKEMGKVRYAGLTIHGDIKETTASGLQTGFYKIINPVLNQPNLELMDAELREAHEKNVSIWGMKTMRGLQGREQELAYLKKALSNPAVTSIVKGIGSFEMFDEYRDAAKEQLTSREDRSLYFYAQRNRSQNCMMCEECNKHCPDGVDVSTALCCSDYYYGQQGDFETALARYHDGPNAKHWSDACHDCRKCEEVCPNGISIVPRLERARQLFA